MFFFHFILFYLLIEVSYSLLKHHMVIIYANTGTVTQSTSLLLSKSWQHKAEKIVSASKPQYVRHLIAFYCDAKKSESRKELPYNETVTAWSNLQLFEEL